LGLQRTGQFKRDVKKARKRGNDLDKLWAVVERLIEGKELDPRHRQHRLSGDWSDFWVCHVEPDWLLIWLEDETDIILVATGTHADLFR
jgi:mRNA interferase YafQ